MRNQSKVRLLERQFGPLFWTQFLGAFNDNVLKNALVILITYRSVTLWGMEPAMVVAFSGALFIAPYFLLSPLAGKLADGLERSFLTKMTKLTELLLMLFATLALSFESYPWLMVLLFFMGCQSTFFGPLKYGMLRDTVGERRLSHANALTSAGTFVAILLGTMMGGGLAALGSLWPLAFALVLISLFGIMTSQLVLALPIHTQERVPSSHLSLWRLCSKRVGVRAHLLAISWFWLLGAIILSILAPLTKDVFYADEWVSTFFLTLFTVGMGLGAALAYRVGQGRAEVGLASIMGIVISLFLLDLSFLTSVSQTSLDEGRELISFSTFLISTEGLRVSFSLLALSTAAGAYIVPLMTALQLLARPAEISRLIAANNVLNALFMILGSVLLMSLLSLQWPYSRILLFLAGLNLVASTLVYYWFSTFTIRVWARLLSFLFFKVSFKGQELLPKDGPYIIVANHVSFVDWLFLMAFCPHPIRFIIDHHYYYAPTMPFWLRQAELIPIATRKDGPELLEQAFERVASHLKAGRVIGIFPEGALSRTGKLRPFLPGLHRILQENPVPVVVIALEGLWGSAFSHGPPGLFRKEKWFKRSEYTVRVLGVKSPEGLKLREIHTLLKNHLEPDVFDAKRGDDS